jgi:cell division protein FtsZ
MGYAMMGAAEASGENAAVAAAEKAISCPLLEAGGVRGARGVLINITGSSQLGLHEVNEACNLIGNATENPDVQINFGVVLDESLADKVKLTVIATGFERETLPAIQRKRQAAASAAALRAETVPHSALPEPEPAMANATPAPEPAAAASVSEKEEAPHANGAAGPDLSKDALIPDPFKDIETPAILRRRLVQ